MARYDGNPMDWQRKPWQQFMQDFQWFQGEHMLFIGETGSGKTTIESQIVPAFPETVPFVVVFVTKQRDDSFSKKRWPGFTRMTKWNNREAAKHRKVLLWPAGGKTLDEIRENQREIFTHALNEIFKQGGWCVVIDEMQYMVDMLGLSKHITMYLHQARSSGITVVSGAQRPANVPVIVYGASMKFFVSRQVEGDDCKRLAQAAGVERDKLEAALLLIPKRDWLFFDRTRNAAGVLTRVKLAA